ncbi:MAG: hypothetical protein JOY75_18465 [Hyphomicrobiales bacterium]|nr:hypothetical protein [Hyphomicrobiales bacterium]
MLQKDDRLWLLPDSFGTPPVLPMLLLTELANLVRAGRKVGLAVAARNRNVADAQSRAVSDADYTRAW